MLQTIGAALKRLRLFSIYSKLVFTFLIVIGPMYVLSLSTINAGAANIRQEISLSIASRTQFYSSSFDTEINRIQDLLREYIMDDDLQNLGNIAPAMTDFERRQAILHVQNKLLLIKSSSLYVEDAKVYIPMIHSTITVKQFDGDMPQNELKALYTNTHGAPFIHWNDELLLSEIYPFPINPSGAPVFAIEVVLQEDNIQKALSQITNFGGGGAVLLGGRMEWSIANEKDRAFVPLLQQFTKRNEFAGKNIGQGQVKLNGQSYLVTFERSAATGAILVVYVPEEQILGPVHAYRNRLWLFSGLSILFVIGFSYWIYKLIHLPLYRLVRAFRKVDKGDLGVTVHHRQGDEFRFLYEQFNLMVGRLQVLIQEVYEQRIRTQRSELKQLQSQINPHFLYNSFFALKRMAQMYDTDQMISFIDRLGDYFQFITRNASDEISLEREVNHAGAYVEIQRVRFAKRIFTVFEQLPDPLGQVQVPRLILQPIIENAYEHGLKEKVAGGIVEVRNWEESECLYVSVEDNGELLSDQQLDKLQRQLADTESESETTALLNVHRRLRLKFGARSGLVLSRGELGGLRVVIQLPMEKVG